MLAAHHAADGHRVAFVGDVVGTGSSRKSACNSLLWHIGEDIPAVPNKRRAGVIIGAVIIISYTFVGGYKAQAIIEAAIRNDVVLIWLQQPRIITGSDILGRLLTGIGSSPHA